MINKQKEIRKRVWCILDEDEEKIESIHYSRDEAEYMLGNDIKAAVADAEKFAWYGCLSPTRKRVIVNMVFNLGLPRFKRFKKTIKFAERGDYQGFSVEMLDSKWARQVGVRAKRLSKMYREG